jgi:alkylation response protein AidB-like acyl-CoA dehydrogenase
VWQAEISLTDLRAAGGEPAARGELVQGRRLGVRRHAQLGRVGALGHATAAYEIAAAYCKQRKQFG